MEHIDVIPLTPTIGAEISGIDLARPLAGADVAAIRAALLEHEVIFFRDQDIDEDDHVRFAQYFGEIDPPPFLHVDSVRDEILVLDQEAPKGQGADRWHADNTHRPRPPMGSILRAVQLPAAGGDTCFSSMSAAYEALSPSMQLFLDGLSAVHTLQMMAERAAEKTPNVRLNDQLDGDGAWPSTVHPVVRVHPETGRKLLNVNANWTKRILELTEEESDAVMALLLEHLRSPMFQCRFRWTPGAIAFWDNRSVQHYAVPDYGERRVMHRITIVGDEPAGPSGRKASPRR